jgi:competence protein ComEA
MARGRELVARVLSRLRESAWWSLVPKAAFGALTLGALALLGSGVLDGWVPTGGALAPAEAAPATRGRRTASASASASSPAPPPASASPSASASASAAPPANGKVVLNTATEADLQKLPGVGPKKAKAIIALREKLGGKFKRLEDLMRVRGLKRRALERIRPLVVLDAETEPSKKPDTR